MVRYMPTGKDSASLLAKSKVWKVFTENKQALRVAHRNETWCATILGPRPLLGPWTY